MQQCSNLCAQSAPCCFIQRYYANVNVSTAETKSKPSLIENKTSCKCSIASLQSLRHIFICGCIHAGCEPKIVVDARHVLVISCFSCVLRSRLHPLHLLAIRTTVQATKPDVVQYFGCCGAGFTPSTSSVSSSSSHEGE